MKKKNFKMKLLAVLMVIAIAIIGGVAVINIVGGKDLKEVEQKIDEFNENHENDILKAHYEYDFDSDAYVISVRSYDEKGEVFGNGKFYNDVDEFVKAEF